MGKIKNRSKLCFTYSEHLFECLLSTHTQQFLYKHKVTAGRTTWDILALSLSASVKVGESPWRHSVEGGCFGKAISLHIRNSHPYD